MAVTASTAELVYGVGTITIRPTRIIARRGLGRHSGNSHVIKTRIVTAHEPCWHLPLSRTAEETAKRVMTGGPSEIKSGMNNFVKLQNNGKMLRRET